jgi:hypothetical protein
MLYSKEIIGFIGELFDFFIQFEFDKMFAYRHKITKSILERKKNV